MASNIISIISFLIFLKLLFFWLWLWQLKEYRLDRFLSHFKGGQAIRKILSSLWWLKYPKFTKKIIIIAFTSLLLAILLLIKGYYLAIFLLIILVPLFFQMPTVIWRKIIFKKARLKREGFKDLVVIGITGSYGKSSTKEFLYAILSEKYGQERVLKTEGNINTEIGVASTVLKKLNENHKFFICEMAAYKRGEIKTACNIVKPKIGILTGINEQHLELFGSQENIIKGKYELIESLPQDGIAFFNAKNKYCIELYQETLRRGSGRAVLYGSEAKFFEEENLLGALAVAELLGLASVDVKHLQIGMEPKKGINGLNIIDSTYSANPTGVIAHLDYLKTLPGKKVLVMPCLIELGEASKEVHQRIGAKIAEVCDLAIITTKDRFREIHETAGEKAIFLESPQEIFEKIKSATQAGDVVLLESRVPKELIRLLND
ncbi:MAG: Mur ligase family protein [Patescibacteria group bacterium]